MTTDVYDFLEHRGVKGMKWGRRKARPPAYVPQQHHPPPRDHSTAKAIGITAAIVVGAAATGIILGKVGNKKAAKAVVEARQIKPAWSNMLFDKVKAVPFSSVKKAASSGTSWESIPNYPKFLGRTVGL